MNDTLSLVESHYGVGGLMDRMNGALAAVGTTIKDATLEQMSAIDQFHACGLDATRQLLQLSGFKSGMHVLDVGSGVGGPARCLAEMAGCQVTGIDLTHEYVDAATAVTRARGLGDRVKFVQGSALATPFAEASFDGAWMQHVNMNIPDKQGLASEVFRVLKPGAKLALHEFFSVNGASPTFPVPWATTSEGSFLADAPAFRTCLESAAFTVEVWNDETEATLAFLRGILRRFAEAGPPALSPGVLLGQRFGEMAMNMTKAVEAGRVCVFMGVARKG